MNQVKMINHPFYLEMIRHISQVHSHESFYDFMLTSFSIFLNSYVLASWSSDHHVQKYVRPNIFWTNWKLVHKIKIQIQSNLPSQFMNSPRATKIYNITLDNKRKTKVTLEFKIIWIIYEKPMKHYTSV